MQNITIDFLTNTLVVTRNFYEAAKQYGSEEYSELTRIMRENPTMSVSIRTINITKTNNDNKGLTYRYMRKFISIMDSKNLSTFEETILYYEGMYLDSTKVYQCVARWFLENYPNHKDCVTNTAPKRVA